MRGVVEVGSGRRVAGHTCSLEAPPTEKATLWPAAGFSSGHLTLLPLPPADRMPCAYTCTLLEAHLAPQDRRDALLEHCTRGHHGKLVPKALMGACAVAPACTICSDESELSNRRTRKTESRRLLARSTGGGVEKPGATVAAAAVAAESAVRRLLGRRSSSCSLPSSSSSSAHLQCRLSQSRTTFGTLTTRFQA